MSPLAEARPGLNGPDSSLNSPVPCDVLAVDYLPCCPTLGESCEHVSVRRYPNGPLLGVVTRLGIVIGLANSPIHTSASVAQSSPFGCNQPHRRGARPIRRPVRRTKRGAGHSSGNGDYFPVNRFSRESVVLDHDRIEKRWVTRHSPIRSDGESSTRGVVHASVGR